MPKNFHCPFCLAKFSSRGFLLNIHIPECDVRSKYFNNEFSPEETEVIRKRVNGENDYMVYIETKTFIGKAYPKEKVYDP